MIYLYRFELLEADAAETRSELTFGTTARDAIDRSVFTLTQYEQAISLPTATLAPLWLPAQPPAGMQTYAPAEIESSGIRLDAEKAAGEITVSLPRDHPLAQLYVLDAPSAQVWLTIATLSGPADGSPLVRWTGRVRSTDFDERRCTFTCMHLGDVANRPGLTRKHPRSCPHALYDRDTCGVDRHAYDATARYWRYREDGLLASVSADGLTIEVPAAANRPDGTFANGIAVLDGTYGLTPSGVPCHRPRIAGGYASGDLAGYELNGGVRRAVVSHVGSTLSLATPLPPGLTAGTRITLYAGCDKQKATCQGVFQNFSRFGGFPYLPTKNPFEVGLRG